jgi:hypothetical protein
MSACFLMDWRNFARDGRKRLPTAPPHLSRSYLGLQPSGLRPCARHFCFWASQRGLGAELSPCSIFAMCCNSFGSAERSVTFVSRPACCIQYPCSSTLASSANRSFGAHSSARFPGADDRYEQMDAGGEYLWLARDSPGGFQDLAQDSFSAIRCEEQSTSTYRRELGSAVLSKNAVDSPVEITVARRGAVAWRVLKKELCSAR